MKYFLLIFFTWYFRLNINKPTPDSFRYDYAIAAILLGLFTLFLIFYDARRKKIIRIDTILIATLSSTLLNLYIERIICRDLSVYQILIAISFCIILLIYLIKLGWSGTMSTDLFPPKN